MIKSHVPITQSQFQHRLLIMGHWLLIILVAAAFRFYLLGAVPTGFQFDEAYNALDAMQVLGGKLRIFFPANGGREPLYTYWQVFWVWLLDATPFVFRWASALAGLLAIPLCYALVRELFPREGRRLAALSAFIMAISFWHIHFSRYGIRAITLPTLEMLAFYFFWRSPIINPDDQIPNPKNSHWSLKPGHWDLVIAGVFLAAGVYAHPAGRIVPVVLLVAVGYRVLADRSRARSYLGALIMAGLVALILFVPLGLHFWQHPRDFAGHPGAVSVFDPRVHAGNVPRALALNILRVAGMFIFQGDVEWIHNLPGRPVFEPLMSIAFSLGVIVLGYRLWRGGLAMNPGRETTKGTGGRPSSTVRCPPERWPYVFLLAWFVIMLLPSILSDAAPNFSRTLGASPAAFILAALGLSAGLKGGESAAMKLAQPSLRWAAWGLVTIVLALSTWTTCRDYFDILAHAEPTYYFYDQDKLDAARYLMREAATAHVYLAPLWAHQASIAFATRDAGIRSFEASHLLVLPAQDSGRDALYAFPSRLDEQSAQIEATARRLPAGTVRQELRDAYGAPLLTLFRVPAALLPSFTIPVPSESPVWAPQNRVTARFGDYIQLLGYTLAGRPVAGAALDLTLYWRAENPADLNYTVFVHLEDAIGRRVAQADGEPGGASYRTTRWSPGDVLLDERQLFLPTNVQPGHYTFSAGWYDGMTGERLPAFDAHGVPLPENRVVLGEVEVGP